MLYLYLFKELKLNGILKELSHGTGAMVDKSLLVECYWFPLKTSKYTIWVTPLVWVMPNSL